MRIHVAVRLGALAYLLALSWLLLTPDPWWIFGSSGRIAEQTLDIQLSDTVQHGSVFAVLAVLTFAAGSGTPWQRLLLLAGLSYAACTELLHAVIPLRSFSLTDLAANLIGFALTWAACLLGQRRVSDDTAFAERARADASSKPAAADFATRQH